jgi:hypothetical protein
MMPRFTIWICACGILAARPMSGNATGATVPSTVASLPSAADDSISTTEPAVTHAVASASSGVLSTTRLAPRFEVRRIPRSEFAPARNASQTAFLTTAREPEPTLDLLRPARSVWWDDIALHFSGNRVVPAQLHRGDEARYGVYATRLLSVGKLELDGQIADRDGLVYVPRGRLKIDTVGGWKFRLGDVDVAQTGPACRGLTGRGFGIDRSGSGDSGRSRLRFGIIGARAPVQHASLIAGQYARSVYAASASSDLSASQSVGVQAYRMTERRSNAELPWRPIREGAGVGVATSIRADRSNLAAEVLGSRFRFATGPVETGTDLRVRGRTRLRAASFGTNIETSHGTPYRAGALGSIQQAPRYVADADAAVRSKSGLNAGLWGGRWKQIPVIVPPGEDESQTLRWSLKNRASQGSQCGGRLGWTIPRVRTGVAFSQEWRWRSLSDRSQTIRSSGVSADQRISRGLRVMLQANRLTEIGGGSRDYVTGNLSLELGGGPRMSLQQQTVWQEPLGPQLVSTIEISSVRLLSNRLTLGASAAQVHQEDASQFRPIQTQGSLQGDVRLGDGVGLSVLYRFNKIGAERNESIEIGFTHSLSGRRGADPLTAMDPAASTRQMLGGVVFEDRNGDGVRQDDEPGIPGIGVIIDNDLRGPVACDASGRYRASVAIGRRLLRLLPESIPTAYSLDRMETIEVDVSADRPVACDFPIVRLTGAIEGRVVHGDEGGLGYSRVPGGVEHVRVVLDDAQFTYTDENGSFSFHQLAPGEHEVRLDADGLPFGFRAVEAMARRVVIERGDDAIAGCEFRLFRPVQRKVF